MSKRSKALTLALDLHQFYRMVLTQPGIGFRTYNYYCHNRVLRFDHPNDIRAMAIKVAKEGLHG